MTQSGHGSHEYSCAKFTLEPLDALGLASNCRVGGGDMELEKARARHSISNTQSVLIVKAEIYCLTRREHDWLPIHDKLQRAFKYDEHAFCIWMVMQAGNRVFFVDHNHRVTALRSDRIVVYKINAFLFLLRQIDHRCGSALSDCEFARKAGRAPAVRLRRRDDFDNASRCAAVVLNAELNAFLAPPQMPVWGNDADYRLQKSRTCRQS